MASYLILDGAGVVQNIVEWDGAAEWSPPVGHTIKRHDGPADIGKTLAEFQSKQHGRAPAAVKDAGGLRTVD